MTASVSTNAPASARRWVLATANMDFRADAQLPSAIRIDPAGSVVVIDKNGVSMLVTGSLLLDPNFPAAPAQLGSVVGTNHILYQ